MNQTIYRRTWLKLHRSYEKRAFAMFRRGLREAAKKIPFDNLDKYNYIPSIEFNVSQNEIFKAFYNVYLKIGLLYGNRVTNGIVKDTKGIELDVFQQAFRTSLQQWLLENAGLSITLVRQSLIDYLIEEIRKGIAEGYDVREMAKRIEKLVNSRNFYRWQALRIARTETTAAANYGATVAAGKSPWVLEKVWISAEDARVRRPPKSDYDHVKLNGVKVGENEMFEDNGAFLMFAGDPKAPAGARINCRCANALMPKRDPNGRLIRK